MAESATWRPDPVTARLIREMRCDPSGGPGRAVVAAGPILGQEGDPRNRRRRCERVIQRARTTPSPALRRACSQSLDQCDDRRSDGHYGRFDASVATSGVLTHWGSPFPRVDRALRTRRAPNHARGSGIVRVKAPTSLPHRTIRSSAARGPQRSRPGCRGIAVGVASAVCE